MAVTSPLTGTENVRKVGAMSVRPLVWLYARNGLDITKEVEGLEQIEVWECIDSGLKFTVPCIVGTSEFYGQVEKAGFLYSEDKYEYQYAASLIPAGARVLDVGCGFGHFSKQLSHASFTGLEYSAHAAQIGRAKGRNILQQSVEDHVAGTGPIYDVVSSFQVLEHVRDPLEFLRAAGAGLKPGGRFIVSVPADDGFLGLAENDAFNLPPHHVTFWPNRALKFAFERLGMEQVVVHHEPLQQDHVEYFVHQLILRGLLRQGDERKYARNDFRFRCANKLAMLLGRRLKNAFDTRHKLALGHTVIATAIKPV